MLYNSHYKTRKINYEQGYKMSVLDLWTANEIMKGSETLIFKKTMLKIRCGMDESEIEEFITQWFKMNPDAPSVLE